MKNGFSRIYCKNQYLSTIIWSLTVRGTVLVDDGKLVECLEFIFGAFFSELEMAMDGVIEALAIYEEKCKHFSVRDNPVLMPLWLLCSYKRTACDAGNGGLGEPAWTIFKDNSANSRVERDLKCLAATRKDCTLCEEAYCTQEVRSCIFLHLRVWYTDAVLERATECVKRCVRAFFHEKIPVMTFIARSPYCTLWHCRGWYGSRWSCQGAAGWTTFILALLRAGFDLDT